jgi:hypothetical protein
MYTAENYWRYTCVHICQGKTPFVPWLCANLAACVHILAVAAKASCCVISLVLFLRMCVCVRVCACVNARACVCVFDAHIHGCVHAHACVYYMYKGLGFRCSYFCKHVNTYTNVIKTKMKVKVYLSLYVCMLCANTHVKLSMHYQCVDENEYMYALSMCRR